MTAEEYIIEKLKKADKRIELLEKTLAKTESMLMESLKKEERFNRAKAVLKSRVDTDYSDLKQKKIFFDCVSPLVLENGNDDYDLFVEVMGLEVEEDD